MADIKIETDLKDRMKNVKQWFHKVKSDQEKRDFIFDFIKKLIEDTDAQPKVVIFFNEKKYLLDFFSVLKSDKRFSDMNDKFNIIHGDQDIKERKLIRRKFDDGEFNYLLTTNLVARGIDFNEVTSVINCDIPVDIKKKSNDENRPVKPDEIDVQTYIHRVGRAGRSNKKGVAISVSNIEGEEAVIDLAKKLDVTIIKYEDFEQIKNHLAECYKHNKEQNELFKTLVSEKSWKDIGISDEFQTQLFNNGFKYPKPSQVICVPKILNYQVDKAKFYKHISVYGFANGRGKTLCFLTPMIEKFKSQEPMSKPWCPQAIIMAHTKDLCLQIGKQIAAIMPPSKKYEISYLFRDTDTKDIKGSICIGTPGYIQKILNSIKTKDLKFLIIDEADEVLDSNKNELRDTLNKIYDDISEGFQLILFSATFEESDIANLEEIIDDDDFNKDDINFEAFFQI
ncbi:DEAD/DEAH-box helicase (macronuclear) [Tetrahymena thermophila SB210]|uniref:ATP-dependent RNA helicase n=1 Tax=Tetrahymena thermophila (strain SB210) TaxID=312017 RepID=Q24DC9_TETTS|nr:DEAD/DEAH-box helicase [Tetrahymena thermophila SB210]EAS05776.1 DEAD/DEAH-box helicase [Tetrahymena thermophila SB210]|eukprot:XP_001026021.1 DEAD/DEAH-box helicase [Tetrahymena thermophila SB210]